MVQYFTLQEIGLVTDHEWQQLIEFTAENWDLIFEDEQSAGTIRAVYHPMPWTTQQPAAKPRAVVPAHPYTMKPFKGVLPKTVLPARLTPAQSSILSNMYGSSKIGGTSGYVRATIGTKTILYNPSNVVVSSS
jgi:hypothetical protein